MNNFKKQIWTFDSSERIQVGPIVKNNIVVFGLWNGTISALDSHTGEKLWSLKIKSALVY
jgi:outer membrane protein assembly factor BamB